MNTPYVVEPCMMKAESDCGVACMAMLTGKSYAEVRAALTKRTNIKEGLGVKQLRNIAERLGFKTRWIRDADLSETVGILGLTRSTDPLTPEGEQEGHWVFCSRASIWNPAEGLLYTDPEVFFDTRRWKPTGLIVREG